MELELDREAATELVRLLIPVVGRMEIRMLIDSPPGTHKCRYVRWSLWTFDHSLCSLTAVGSHTEFPPVDGKGIS